MKVHDRACSVTQSELIGAGIDTLHTLVCQRKLEKGCAQKPRGRVRVAAVRTHPTRINSAPPSSRVAAHRPHTRRRRSGPPHTRAAQCTSENQACRSSRVETHLTSDNFLVSIDTSKEKRCLIAAACASSQTYEEQLEPKNNAPKALGPEQRTCGWPEK